jgi:hypothetical protein
VNVATGLPHKVDVGETANQAWHLFTWHSAQRAICSLWNQAKVREQPPSVECHDCTSWCLWHSKFARVYPFTIFFLNFFKYFHIQIFWLSNFSSEHELQFCIPSWGLFGEGVVFGAHPLTNCPHTRKLECHTLTNRNAAYRHKLECHLGKIGIAHTLA